MALNRVLYRILRLVHRVDESVDDEDHDCDSQVAAVDECDHEGVDDSEDCQGDRDGDGTEDKHQLPDALLCKEAGNEQNRARKDEAEPGLALVAKLCDPVRHQEDDSRANQQEPFDLHLLSAEEHARDDHDPQQCQEQCEGVV